MHAVVLEVNATEENLPQAREGLPQTAVPAAREAGALAGYWLAPTGTGRGVAVVVFETEDAAKALAAQFQIGAPAGPIPDVTVRSVEVREVIASL